MHLVEEKDAIDVGIECLHFAGAATADQHRGSENHVANDTTTNITVQYVIGKDENDS